jgi:SAM-dependent methyltransferase
MEAQSVRQDHIRPGYVTRTVPTYFADDEPGITAQPDVYAYAASVARVLQRRTIVDIGCGSGQKLRPLAASFGIIGIDFGPNIAAASKNGFGSWRDHDLSADAPLPLTGDEAAEALFVSADVIEHLVDPWLYLRRVIEAMGDAGVAVLSTPERELTHGDIHEGPPRNPSHVREWSIRELDLMLQDAGLSGRSLGLTRSNDQMPYLNTILAVVSRDPRWVRLAAEAVVAMTPANADRRSPMKFTTLARRCHALLVRRF